MKVDTQILINAPSSVVRKVILDFDNYSSWNPFLTSVNALDKKTDEIGAGDLLDVYMTNANGKVSNFKPTVTANSPQRFEWQGTLLSAWVFSGIHRFEFKDVDGGKACEFRQSENFSGWALPLLKFMLSGVSKNFTSMNEALKKECEKS
ncbi:SRPBCC domain-containing protein LALA0_S07e05688g [Lachancea lanzarotensis]|uniref:LALA0S07e05688g1_1 n=1 Tax=Lachancea lanzarotensis TaxID=1245769 RepID=A0A0C7MZK7_9SACH|nr:uncharacterized protein LALA0_S07e05688g [Lachancea lanzarotensis]CEP63242.1 LALA0S07e05688g1_1 [Lachancea lanzarotensis]